MEQNQKTSLSFDEKNMIIFQEGLFGFEEFKQFLPVSMEENSDAILCLQSVEEETLSFIVMNPFLFSPGYQPEVSEADKEALKAEKEENLSYYVLCVVKEPLEESTVNLKCPIVVNAMTRQARQVILESDRYELRHTLKELSQREGDSC